MESINFNVPYLTGKETAYIIDAVGRKKLSGNGHYNKLCQQYLNQRYGFGKSLLTNSCTDALEMCALLLRLQPGDEVIVPSYTFVSTASAFILHGARVVFADSNAEEPNLDVSRVEALITPRTRAIVAVHYAGFAVDMDPLLALARKYNLVIIEDAAQAIESFYKGKALGSIGSMAAFSFHETKNIISGEGGLLSLNDAAFFERAEIIWEKGTNRAAFFRGEVAKYNWVDIGASYLPSEVTAAFLYAQLEQLEQIQARRVHLFNRYARLLEPLESAGYLKRAVIPAHATVNGHMFYVLCNSLAERTALIDHLKSKGIMAVFHYLALHESPYYHDKHDGRELPRASRFADILLRLPMFYELTEAQQDYIAGEIQRFFRK
ncbi:MAG: dTDP-4-amino-4,6-dideoxygalactose transaminase [Bacteroidetes bacterium]|nr:dTDP-4-amino-4,6-dideoxygalactose transaminase [Bacteroidota bacterium]